MHINDALSIIFITVYLTASANAVSDACALHGATRASSRRTLCGSFVDLWLRCACSFEELPSDVSATVYDAMTTLVFFFFENTILDKRPVRSMCGGRIQRSEVVLYN